MLTPGRPWQAKTAADAKKAAEEAERKRERAAAKAKVKADKEAAKVAKVAASAAAKAKAKAEKEAAVAAAAAEAKAALDARAEAIASRAAAASQPAEEEVVEVHLHDYVTIDGRSWEVFDIDHATGMVRRQLRCHSGARDTIHSAAALRRMQRLLHLAASIMQQASCSVQRAC